MGRSPSQFNSNWLISIFNTEVKNSFPAKIKNISNVQNCTQLCLVQQALHMYDAKFMYIVCISSKEGRAKVEWSYACRPEKASLMKSKMSSEF